MTRRISGSGGSDFDMRFFGGSFLAFLFFIGMLLCGRFAAALLWENDYPNLQLYSNIACLAGIFAWIIFVIAGRVRHSGESRGRLIMDSVLAIINSVLFWFGHTLVSLMFATLIFLILGLYFIHSMDDIPKNQLD